MVLLSSITHFAVLFTLTLQMSLGVQQLLVTSTLAKFAWQQGVGRGGLAAQHPVHPVLWCDHQTRLGLCSIPQTVQIATCSSLCGLLQGMLVVATCAGLLA